MLYNVYFRFCCYKMTVTEFILYAIDVLQANIHNCLDSLMDLSVKSNNPLDGILRTLAFAFAVISTSTRIEKRTTLVSICKSLDISPLSSQEYTHLVEILNKLNVERVRDGALKVRTR